VQVTEQNLQRWDALFESRAWGRYPPEELIRFTARSFPDLSKRADMHALEVGCGPGANIWFLAREGFNVCGIDGSAHAIEQARARLREESLIDAERRADLRVGNFSVLPWPDDAFDLVIDIEAIYANVMPVIRSTFSEIHRVLKPGGWFFAKMFGPQTTGITSGDQLEAGTTADPSEGPMHGKGIAHAFSAEEIRHELRGFSTLTVDWVHRSDRNEANHVFEWLVQARK
jgi:ubiquinone/menaquinone biosynthesis C-methylase UbiE